MPITPAAFCRRNAPSPEATTAALASALAHSALALRHTGRPGVVSRAARSGASLHQGVDCSQSGHPDRLQTTPLSLLVSNRAACDTTPGNCCRRGL